MHFLSLTLLGQKSQQEGAGGTWSPFTPPGLAQAPSEVKDGKTWTLTSPSGGFQHRSVQPSAREIGARGLFSNPLRLCFHHRHLQLWQIALQDLINLGKDGSGAPETESISVTIVALQPFRHFLTHFFCPAFTIGPLQTVVGCCHYPLLHEPSPGSLLM